MKDLEELNIESVDSIPLNEFTTNLENLILIPFGDNHYGHKCVDKKLMYKTLKYVKNTPNAYMIGMGDLLECATRDSVGAGIYEQEEIVQMQYEDMVGFLENIKEKIIGLHTGNHEFRVYKNSGFDLIKTMSRELGVNYLGNSALTKLNVEEQKYVLYSTHGSSGALMPQSKLMACYRLSNVAVAEVYLMGHVHELNFMKQNLFKVNNGEVVLYNKYFVLTGSYLKYWGSYAQEKGYPQVSLGSPKLEFSGLEHKVDISLNL